MIMGSDCRAKKMNEAWHENVIIKRIRNTYIFTTKYDKLKNLDYIKITNNQGFKAMV